MVGRAMRALHGVGDHDLGQWLERPRAVLHIRRRLSLAEVLATGMVMRDVRGTPDYDRLLQPVRHLLPAGYEE